MTDDDMTPAEFDARVSAGQPVELYVTRPQRLYSLHVSGGVSTTREGGGRHVTTVSGGTPTEPVPTAG